MHKRKGILVLALFLTLTLSFTSAVQADVKNMIVMVGDGLGTGQIDLARYFEGGKDGELELMKMPHVAMMKTSSAEGVTDSGAAGTALATGFKAKNGMIGMAANGTEVDSITDYAQVLDKSVGVISTNKVNDATPAAFTATVEDRGESEEISRQIIENDIDVAFGGGRGDFDDELLEKAEEKGYEYVTDEDELKEVEGSKALGLFNDSYMNYVQDRDVKDSNEPDLVEMTAKAIDILSKNEDGFFLMSEGARIDHAAHAADIPGVVAETLEFDEAVKHAMDWADENGDTLVVVVADHETMGFSVTEPMDKEALEEIEVSPEYMASKLEEKEEGNGFTIESIQEVFEEYANIELSEDEAVELNKKVVNDDGSLMYTYLVGWEIGSVIAEKYYAGADSSEIRAKSDTGGHTLNSVPVFAYGEEAEEFDGMIDNTEFNEILFDIFKPF
ncbi:MAG: alkaline phosphatase [Halanaerobiales bacterium]